MKRFDRLQVYQQVLGHVTGPCAAVEQSVPAETPARHRVLQSTSQHHSAHTVYCTKLICRQGMSLSFIHS